MGRKVLTAYERALEEGKFETKLETARKMKEYGDSLEKIFMITGLSEEQLRENGIL
jgi:predicted transposase/invertase (TIGR01784 family)